MHLGYVAGIYPEDNDDIENDNLIDVNISEQLTCKVCFEGMTEKEKEFNSLPCEHSCCTSCWVNYLQALITEGKVENIKCVEHNCEQIISEDFIMKHIKDDKKLVSKYKKFKTRDMVLKDPNKKMCPETDCDSYLEKSFTTKYVYCKVGHYYCFECLRPPHGEDTCESVLEKDFLVWKKDKVVKKCPKCKIYTEKNEGCNHMTCASCKYQWCWLCEGEYKYGHYASGRCNNHQFTKANSIEEIEKREKKTSINYTSTTTNYNYNRYNNNLINNNYNRTTNTNNYNTNLYNRNNTNNYNRYNNNLINRNNSNNRYNNNLYISSNYSNNNRINNNYSTNTNNNNNRLINLRKRKINKYFPNDEIQTNCCFSLSSIFRCCLHKVNYLKDDMDGYERLNALFIWFFGYFLFVAYQVYNTSRDSFCKYNSFRNSYVNIGMLISFCLFICYQIYFTVLITPFILICMVYPFFVYRIKMFFTIGDAHYFDKTSKKDKLISDFIEYY
jgi:hypothetical protein